MKKRIEEHIVKAKHVLSAPDFIKILALRTIGNFLLLSSFFLIAKTFSKPISEEMRYWVDKFTGKTYVVSRDFGSDEQKGGLVATLGGRNIEILQPVDAEFGIVIPKIAANASIIPAVDASNQKEYLSSLQKGVAHAAGTSFPGERGHIYLFAHSTDYFWNVGTYNAVFYLLYKLGLEDEIDLFYQGRRYVYKVTETKIVSPRDVQYLTRKTDDEFLTLQTCWPPGTTLKRLLVFAKRVAE